MKSKEELNTIQEEAETLEEKLAELTKEELTQVSGGSDLNRSDVCGVIKDPRVILEDEDTAEEATKLAQKQVRQQKEQGMIASSNQIKANVFGLLQ